MNLIIIHTAHAKKSKIQIPEREVHVVLIIHVEILDNAEIYLTNTNASSAV